MSPATKRLVILSAALIAGTTLTSVHADVKSIEPRFVTVEKDGTPMKCQIGAPFYPVSLLKAGQVLRVDGEDGSWLRADYLPGMTAFVKIDEAAVDTSGKTVQLKQPCRLWAINASGSDRSPWWNLLEHELPQGQPLRVTETITAISGLVSGYIVEAPTQARGYVKADAVRAAHAEEIAAYRKLIPASTPAPVATAASAPAAGSPGPTSAPADPVPPTPVTAAPCEVDVLKARFAKVMAAKDNEQDVTSLIVEFKCKLATLTATAQDKNARATLNQGLNALTLRRDVLAAQKRIRNAELAAAGEINK
jgi:hypothetical protein